MISGKNWSSCLREDVLRLQDFIHIYTCSPGTRADNPGGQNFECNGKGLLL